LPHDTLARLNALEAKQAYDSPEYQKTKALTIGAQYDEMDPEDMKKMAGLMQNAAYAFCPQGSHMAMRDDQQVYFKQLLDFLRGV
jgi:proline iminopeptidase